MTAWLVFSVCIIVALGLDLFVHRKDRTISMPEAIGWSIFWISLSLIFNIYVYYIRGAEDALNFLTGYLIEKSLSVDNLFVFALIFRYFNTPTTSLRKVLFWGVLGAVVMRAIFIAGGIVLLQKFHWTIYLFGAFLVYTGIKLAFEEQKNINPEANPVIKLFRSFLPITEKYEKDHFFIKRAGRLFATPLFIVLISIETTDVIFALDSIPAILAITYDPFIVFTSNIFAILGLRALYFVLARTMELYHFLHYGLSLILVLIGTKMLLSEFIKIPTEITLGFVLVILVSSIAISIKFPEKNSKT